MTAFAALDNPIWNALTTAHQSMARSIRSARRYPTQVSPLAGLREPTPQAFSDMRALVNAGEAIALFTPKPIEVPADWQVMRSRPLEQMICTKLARSSQLPFLTLGPSDIPEMLTLTAATEPGPFLTETIRMGRYIGIRSNDGRLAAMAGQRLNLNGFTEISAVCTDPDFRGRGHAQALIVPLATQILAEGKIPFLHVKAENGAKALYEKIGFTVRCSIHLTVITAQ